MLINYIIYFKSVMVNAEDCTAFDTHIKVERFTIFQLTVSHSFQMLFFLHQPLSNLVEAEH